MLLNLDILTRSEQRAETLRKQLYEAIEKESTIKTRLDRGRLKVVDLIGAGLTVRELGPAELARFDPDAALFFNVNTPDDYDLAVRKFKRQNE